MQIDHADCISSGSVSVTEGFPSISGSECNLPDKSVRLTGSQFGNCVPKTDREVLFEIGECEMVRQEMVSGNSAGVPPGPVVPVVNCRIDWNPAFSTEHSGLIGADHPIAFTDLIRKFVTNGKDCRTGPAC